MCPARKHQPAACDYKAAYPQWGTASRISAGDVHSLHNYCEEMKRLILVSLLVCSGLAFAEEKPPIELKRKSSFAMTGEDRNPFWPIGFHPAAKAAVESAGPTIPASAFAVTSITLGG